MSAEWSRYFKELGMSAHEIEQALKAAPPDIVAFLNTVVMPEIEAQKKIQAIKALRMESGFGLKMAKDIVDVICTMKTPLKPTRYSDPVLIDAIEEVEYHLKKAIRKSVSDDKSASILLAIREQLSDLWEDLVESPPRPEPKKDGPTW